MIDRTLTQTLVSTWAFLPWDAPNYHVGNGLNLATSIAIFIVSVMLLAFMKWDNKRREGKDVDAELAGKNVQSIEDLDWKHPSFMWRP